MSLEILDGLETINPRPLPPWGPPAFEEIEVEFDRDAARNKALATRATFDIMVYSDALGRHGHLGAAVVALDKNLEVIELRRTQVGLMDQWSVQVAELIGIFHAISLVYKRARRDQKMTAQRQILATILCDSRATLQAIQNPSNKSRQRIVHAILQAATEVKTSGIALRLQWVPGHCDDLGNDTADRLAKEAARPGKTHSFRPLFSREQALIRDKISAQWEQE